MRPLQSNRSPEELGRVAWRSNHFLRSGGNGATSLDRHQQKQEHRAALGALLPTPAGSTNRSSNSTGSTSSDPPPPPITLVLDGFLIFLAGAAIVACLLLFAYAVLLLAGRLRGFWRRRYSNDRHSPNAAAADEMDLWEQQLALELNVAGGLGNAILREAGLAGLTKEERKMLLHRILQSVPFSEKEGPVAEDPISSPERRRRRGSRSTPATPETSKMLVDRLPPTPTPSTSIDDDNASATEIDQNTTTRGNSAQVTTSPSRRDVEEGLPLDEGSARDSDGAVSQPNRSRRRIPSWRSGASSCAPSRQPSTTSAASQLDGGLDDSTSGWGGGGGGGGGGVGDDFLHTCSICLSRYEADVPLLVSRHCSHVFHYKCCMEWLDQHDVCPYCRSPMFTADELQTAAWDALDRLRVLELRHNWGEWEKRLAAARSARSGTPTDHPGIIAQLYNRS